MELSRGEDGAESRSLVVEGTVLSLARGADEAVRSVTLRGGRVEALSERSAAPAGPGKALLDFGERAVIPAFIDAHVHLENCCVSRHLLADCRAPSHATISDIQETLLARARDTEPGEWVMGQGNLFLDRKIADGRLPTRAELDAVSTKHPVILRAGGHTSVINTPALEGASLERYLGRQGMMGDAVVELGDDGRPSGVISELDKALGLPTTRGEELSLALVEGSRDLLLQHGITAIGEISETPEGIERLRAATDAGEIPLRVAAYLWVPGTCSFADGLRYAREDPDGSRLTIAGLKLFADGGYSSRNAAAPIPFVNPDGSVAEQVPVSLAEAEIAAALRDCAEAGLQLAVHCNGEVAQQVSCEAIVGAGVEAPRRPRIEHAGNVLIEYEDVEAWRRAGVTAVPQPGFIYNYGEFLPDYLGPRVEGARFRFRSLLDDGHRLAAGSDGFMGCEQRQTEPLFGVWCCVARQGFAGAAVEPEEAISVVEALRMHTLDAAAAICEEEERGSLEPGKCADLVVLDRDPRACSQEELAQTRVDYVFVDGQEVFAREGAAPPRTEGAN